MYYSDIELFFDKIVEPGSVYELRCPKAEKYKTVSGYFNDAKLLAAAAEHWSENAPGVYVTINPVNPALLARSANTVTCYAKHTTSDSDVVRRLYLLVDFDPVRPAGISSSNAEHQLALECAEKCLNWLAGLGFPPPIFGDSGNGAHLLYRIDLPNDEAATTLVKSFLQALDSMYSDERVTVDKTTFNASRISKVYGTKTKKGSSTEDRPHRMARLIALPEKMEVVPADLLRHVVSLVSLKDPPLEQAGVGNTGGAAKSVEWVNSFVIEHSIEVSIEKSGGGDWAGRWVLERCPFCGESDSSAVITVSKAGKIGYRCHHNRCAQKGWSEFRSYFESARDQPGRKDDPLLELVFNSGELWHSGQEAYISVGNLNHKIGSASFGNWLRGEWFKHTRRGISDSRFRDAIETAKAKAIHEGKEYSVAHRVVRQNDSVFVDIGDETGEAVEITAEGWKIVQRPPVKFIRSTTTGILPRPIKSDQSGLTLLRCFLNLSDSDFVLFVGGLLDAMKGYGPYLVVPVTGEHGASKSTLCRLVVRLLDPQIRIELRGSVRDEQELAIAASNRLIVVLDNLSKLPEWLSDALCRVSTGSGFSARKLYTDGEESVMTFCRPIWMNGIEEFVTREDLISRSSPLFALKIEDGKRRAEGEFWSEFQKVAPIILGTLYDAVAYGLRAERAVLLDTLPRMADTARWLAACLPAFGWKYDDWLLPFNEKQFEAEEATVEGCLAAACLRDWWDGKEHVLTPSELYEKLKGNCPEDKQKFFPASVRTLTNSLRRVAPSLRKYGIDYHRPEHKRRLGGGSPAKVVVVRPVTSQRPETDDAAVASSQALPKGFNSLATHETLQNRANSGLLPSVAKDLLLFNSEEGNRESEGSAGRGRSTGSTANPWLHLATTAETPSILGENVLPRNQDPSATLGNAWQQTVQEGAPHSSMTPEKVSISERPPAGLAEGERTLPLTDESNWNENGGWQWAVTEDRRGEFVSYRLAHDLKSRRDEVWHMDREGAERRVRRKVEAHREWYAGYVAAQEDRNAIERKRMGLDEPEEANEDQVDWYAMLQAL